MDLISTYLNESSDYIETDYKHQLCILFENGIIDNDIMIGVLNETANTGSFKEKMKDFFAFLSGDANSGIDAISMKVDSELQEIRSRINKARDTKTLSEISSELVVFKTYFNKMKKHKLNNGNGMIFKGYVANAKEKMFKRQDEEIEILFEKIKEKKKTL